MGLMTRPQVFTLDDGSKYFEQEYRNFSVKVYLPYTGIDGMVHNYTFKAPLLLVFDDQNRNIDQAIAFAKEAGFDEIAKRADSSVIFVTPTAKEGWAGATVELYQELISEVKMHSYFEDGICDVFDFFTKEFKGYFIRGAIFRADIYSYGASADYVAKNLLTTIEGEYLWGPGDITPAMCSMEGLSVVPKVGRNDIPIISVANDQAINDAFAKCEHVLIKDKADYIDDYDSFVWIFKRWCGELQCEPDLAKMNMTMDARSVMVKTSPDHYGDYKETKEHPVGYFAYYNKDLFENGPAQTVIAFHGGGDSAFYFTYITGWYEIANRYNILYVAIENHQNVTATEAVAVIDDIKKHYNVDEHRLYATGFSMGSGKTWDMFAQYPQMFAGIMPHSAMFPVKSNPFGWPICENLNMTVKVPVFYSGGEESFLGELPMQSEWAVERVQYVAEVNDCKKRFDISFEDKENWPDLMFGEEGDRVEKIFDESRGSTLTVRYYDSNDGVCRTAFASVSGQNHECRHHSCEEAWKFVSKFSTP